MIRNIRKLEKCEARFLKEIVPLPGKVKVHVPYYIPWEEIPIVGLSSMEVSDSVSNGLRTYVTKVLATMEKRLPHLTTTTVFRVTDVQGRRYIVGSKDRPYPLITQEDRYAGKANEQSACTLTVTLTSNIPAMEVA